MPAQTLAQMNLMTFSPLLAGIRDEIIEESPMLARLPFVDFSGNAFAYDRESTLPSPSFYEVDEVIPSQNQTVTQVTIALRMIAGATDVPGLSDTKDNVNDIMANEVRQLSKGLLRTVKDKIIYGNNTNNPEEFNGLQALQSATYRTSEGSSATGSALNFSNLDIAFDNVRPGMPDILALPRAIRRRISQFTTAANAGMVEQRPDEFGLMRQWYNGTQLAINDFQVITETIASDVFSAKTGGATASIHLIRYGYPDGLFGLQGSGGMQVVPIGELEDKDNKRMRVKWYLTIGLGTTRSMATVDGITDAAAVA